jgi:hypothetical protein
MKVGDLVQDAHSIVMGIVVQEEWKVPWQKRDNLHAEKRLHFCVRWVQPPGEMRLSTKQSWRRLGELRLLSASP